MSSKLFDIIESLKSYEEHPCLWNKTIPDFHNRLKRDAAEEQLLPISGLVLPTSKNFVRKLGVFVMAEVECINKTSNSNNEKEHEEHITSTPVNIRKDQKTF